MQSGAPVTGYGTGPLASLLSRLRKIVEQTLESDAEEGKLLETTFRQLIFVSCRFDEDKSACPLWETLASAISPIPHHFSRPAYRLNPPPFPELLF